MKITAVETLLLCVPYQATGGLRQVAGQAGPGLNMLLVQIRTDEGVNGWGEAFGHAVAPATKAALDTLVGPMIVGRDPRDIAGLMDELQRRLHLFGRGGPVHYALSGLDIALWDIAGKLAGLPLHQLLGGAAPTELPVYSSFLRCTDPQAVTLCCEEALDQGFQHVKLHEVDTASVRAAREAVGPEVEIMLDTNCPWSVGEAVEMVRTLDEFRLYWLEEPVWPPEDHEGLARVRAAGAVVSAGENANSLMDFKSLFASGSLDVAQPSVTKIGGMTELRKVAALAEAYGVRVVLHSGYLGPGYLATLHLTAAMPRENLVERLNVKLEASPFGDYTEVHDAKAKVPQGPGLGCDPDLEVAKRFRVL